MGPEPVRIVLYCAHWRRIGGSERYALWLAEQLVERGHSLLVLHLEGAGQERAGLRFARVEGRPSAATRALLREFAADLALILSPLPAALFAWLARNLPIVRFVQDHTLFCPGLDKMRADGEACHRPLGGACLEAATRGPACHGLSGRGRLRRTIAALARTTRDIERQRSVSFLVVASEWMRWELLRLGFAQEQVVCLRYPAMEGKPGAAPGDLPGWVGAVVGEGSGEHPPPILLTPSRLVLPDKGLDRLIDALALLRSPFQAVVAGDGPDRLALEDRARRAGLGGRVHFCGWLDDAALQRLYSRARAVAFPSIWDEPFGLVGLEAMAHAKPVVAFDVGGVREWLVPGVTGELVPRGDVAAFAARLERLLADPEHARRLGQAGLARLRSRFDPRAHLESLEALLAAARGSAVGVAQR